MVDMDLLKLGGKLGGAAIIARAEDEVEKLFEGWSVARRATQNGFQEADGFLREPVAGEQVDIGEGLGDELLGLFVKRRLGRDGDGSGFVASNRCKGGFRVGTQLWRSSLGDRCLQIFCGSGGSWLGS